MRFALAFIFAFLLTPALAFAAEVALVPLEDDPFKLVEQIVQAAGSKNWLLLVPLVLVGVMFVIRRYVGPRVPWLQTDRGGALLALLTAILTAVVTAVAAPGPHTFVSVLVATVTILFANKMVYLWFNKVVSPTGADKTQELEAKVKALESKLAVAPSAVVADTINKAATELK